MNSYEDTETPKEQAQDVLSSAQNRAQEALQTGGNYVRENPIPTVLGAFLVGIALGALLCPRSKPEPDNTQKAKEWLENALGEISHRIPKAKKHACELQSSLADHAQDLGKKLKFW